MKLLDIYNQADAKAYISSTDNVDANAVLERLFDVDDSSSPLGMVQVCLEYQAAKSENGLTGFEMVSKEALSNHQYEVSIQNTDTITVTLLDYVDYFWPNAGGKVNMTTKEANQMCTDRMLKEKASLADKATLVMHYL